MPRRQVIQEDVDDLVYRRFESEKALEIACLNLTPQTAVVTLCGMMSKQEYQYHGLREALLGSSAAVGAVYASTRPPEISLITTAGVPRRLARLIASVLHGRLPARHLRQRTRELILGRRRGRQSAGRNCLVWEWTGPGKSPVDPTLINPVTRRRRLHTWDYDSELKYPTPRGQREGMVFLESMGPLHPDFVTLGIPTYVSAEVWFRYIREELSILQSFSGRSITIAAHPRADSGFLEEWYAPFPVTYGRTRELIARAEVVVAAEPSTALGLCALYETPVHILDPMPLYPGHLEQLESYCRTLGVTRTTGSALQANWFPSPGSAKHKEFVDAFMKEPGSVDEPFWHSVIGDICAKTSWQR